jgi:hypothetical protein
MKLKRCVVPLVLFALLLMSFAAFAQDQPTDPSAPGPIATLLHSILMAVSSVLVSILVAYAASQLKKNGIELSAQQQALLKEWAQQAIAYAEEWAAKLVKDKVTVTSSQKLGVAKEFFKTRVQEGLKLNLTDTQADQHVHAALGGSSLGASDVPGLTHELQ